MEPQTAASKSLYRLFAAIFAVLVIIATAFFFFKNLEQRSPEVPTQDEFAQVASSTEEIETPEGVVRPDGTTMISGMIVEILTKPDMTDKWITVLHVDELGNTLEYKFFISADSIVTAPIEGGQKVTLTFIGSPSTVDFVLAKTISTGNN
jgi:hypothetical protein